MKIYLWRCKVVAVFGDNMHGSASVSACHFLLCNKILHLHMLLVVFVLALCMETLFQAGYWADRKMDHEHSHQVKLLAILHTG